MGSRANSNPFSSFAATTNDGHTICPNFNTQSGYTFPNCVYVHVCNRSISGEMLVDKRTHSGYSYISAIQQPAGTPSQWLPLSNYLLNQDVWLREFQGHEDKNFLADGIVNGFQLADIGTTFTPMDMQNYKPATSSSTKARVVKTIREEIMQGNYVITSSKPTVVNALGAIPMPNSTEYELFTIFLGFIGRLWTTMLLLAPLNFNGMTQLSWLGLNT